MARRGSITEAQIFEAADALVAQGREVTPTALLSAVGSGSFTTIYKHLSEWEKSQKSAGAERSVVIPDSVLSGFGAAWRAALLEANKEVALVREQAAEEVKAAKAQFQEALQTIERLEAESEVDTARIEELSAKIAKLEESLHRSENEKSAFKATLDQIGNQLKAQEAELARLHHSIEKDRKEREAAIKEAAELNGQVQLLKAQNSELISKLSERDGTKKGKD